MNVTGYLLTCLAEERNEVAQRAAKGARFGINDIQEGQGADNTLRLIRKLNADPTPSLGRLQRSPARARRELRVSEEWIEAVHGAEAAIKTKLSEHVNRAAKQMELVNSFDEGRDNLQEKAGDQKSEANGGHLPAIEAPDQQNYACNDYPKSKRIDREPVHNVTSLPSESGAT